MRLHALLVAMVATFIFCAIAADAQPKVEVEVSPLIGTWTLVLTMDRAGPTQITTITINEDGVYHWLHIDMDPGDTDLEDPKSYAPVGADLRHSSGQIDLKTGKEKISNADRKLSVKSVVWTVSEGKLLWSMDMGGMGGQAMTFTRADLYSGERVPSKTEDAEQSEDADAE